MTREEAKKAFDELKAQGETDESILAVLYGMFSEDTIELDELESLISVLGYELSEEFKNMSPEDQKTKGFEYDEDAKAEGVSEEDVDDAKEYDKEEDDKEEPKAKPEEEDDEKEDDDEESDDDKARRLFGFDK